MCFSAPVSFLTGVVTSGIGVKAIQKVKEKREYPLATIPILFGVQQFVEGGIWLSFGHAVLNKVLTYIYIFFSHIWWPFFVPMALWLVENERVRKRVLFVIMLIGIGVSLNFMIFTISGPLSSEVAKNSIVYTCNYYNIEVVTWFYMIATTICCFISSHKIIQIFGATLLFSAVIAYHFYIHAFTSVWCFFAAVLSLIIYWHFRKGRRP